jgi:hypothetical protein
MMVAEAVLSLAPPPETAEALAAEALGADADKNARLAALAVETPPSATCRPAAAARRNRKMLIKDTSDYLVAGGDAAALLALVEKSPSWTAPPETAEALAAAAVVNIAERTPTRTPAPAPATLAAAAERQAGALLDATPPQDLLAEKAALGAMLLDAKAATTCVEMLRPEDFIDPAHRKLFAFLTEHREPGEQADLVTVSAALRAAGLLGDLGGQDFLLELCESCPIVANAPAYCRIVRHAATQREAVQAGLDLAREAAKPKADVPDLLKCLDTRMQRVAEVRDDARPMTAAALVTQFPHLRPPVIDGWLRRGEVGTLAAASKSNKSWLLMHVGLCVATGRTIFERFPTQQGAALIVDYELSGGTLARRLRDVAGAMELNLDDVGDSLNVISLRGKQLDIGGLGDYLKGLTANST